MRAASFGDRHANIHHARDLARAPKTKSTGLGNATRISGCNRTNVRTNTIPYDTKAGVAG